jgi:hypothetical protein
MEHAQGWQVERADIIKKVTLRLIPFVGLIYLIAYICNIAPMLFLAACLAFGGLMTFVVQAAIRRRRDDVSLVARPL